MNNKRYIITGIIVALVISLPLDWHLSQRLWHNGSKPSKTICVDGYNTFIPIYIHSGSITTMYMNQIWNCTKETPNPNYQQELLKWEGK
jgi:hypothetical protein